MEVNFSLNNQTIKFKESINNLFLETIKVLKINNNILVNVATISKSQIKKLNNQYRNVNKVTDVLSFPMIDDINQIEQESDYFTGLCNVGDIYINLAQAKEQALQYGHSLKREFCFLALHGFLHLLGYDHIKQEDEKVMFSLQNKILNKVNIGRD